MISKTVKYTDFLGNEREEEFLFNLTHDEVMQLDVGADGKVGLQAYINKIASTQDPEKLYNLFRDVILSGYGEVVDGGRRFAKSKEAREAFSQTQAFNDIVVEFLTDAADGGSGTLFMEFVKGMIPAEPKQPEDHKQVGSQ